MTTAMVPQRARSKSASEVPEIKNLQSAKEFERIMGNLVKAVLTRRPLNVTKYISEYLKSELMARTFCELQASMRKNFFVFKSFNHVHASCQNGLFHISHYE